MRKNLAKVFIDTNILKFSAVKKYCYLPKTTKNNWNGEDYEGKIYEHYTANDINKIKNDTQKRDAVFLGILAYAGISGSLEYFIHREVDLELWGLPGTSSPSGRFFDCPLSKIQDPFPPKERIVFGGEKKFREHTLDFLSSIQEPRYLEITKMTGAFQGAGRSLHLNQALDAYFIWCAECAGLEYFLTMDYKLIKVVASSKRETAVKLITPEGLLRDLSFRLGFFGSISLFWNGYRFAKPRVGFEEGAGWK